MQQTLQELLSELATLYAILWRSGPSREIAEEITKKTVEIHQLIDRKHQEAQHVVR